MYTFSTPLTTWEYAVHGIAGVSVSLYGSSTFIISSNVYVPSNPGVEPMSSTTLVPLSST